MGLNERTERERHRKRVEQREKGYRQPEREKNKCEQGLLFQKVIGLNTFWSERCHAKTSGCPPFMHFSCCYYSSREMLFLFCKDKGKLRFQSTNVQFKR